MLSRLLAILLCVPAFCGLQISGDVLFLKPSRTGLDYIRDNSVLKEVDLDWTAGFRLGVETPCASALYTRFSFDKSTTKGPGVFVATRVQGGQNTVRVSSARPVFSLNYDVVDLLLHYPNCYVTPFLGVRAAWIDQEFAVDYVVIVNNTPLAAREKVDMRGFGMKMGLHFQSDYFCDRFSYFVSPSFSLVRGFFEGSWASSESGSIPAVSFNYDFNYLVPSAALDVGAEVMLCNICSSQLFLTIGYTAEWWWLQDFLRPEGEVNQYIPKDQAQFGFQGGFARLQMRF